MISSFLESAEVEKAKRNICEFPRCFRISGYCALPVRTTDRFLRFFSDSLVSRRTATAIEAEGGQRSSSQTDRGLQFRQPSVARPSECSLALPQLAAPSRDDTRTSPPPSRPSLRLRNFPRLPLPLPLRLRRSTNARNGQNRRTRPGTGIRSFTTHPESDSQLGQKRRPATPPALGDWRWNACGQPEKPRPRSPTRRRNIRRTMEFRNTPFSSSGVGVNTYRWGMCSRITSRRRGCGTRRRSRSTDSRNGGGVWV